MKKKAVIFTITILSIYLVFLGFEIMRLKILNTGSRPLITLKKSISKEKERYSGLGYQIIYLKKCDKKSSDLELCQIYETKFSILGIEL